MRGGDGEAVQFFFLGFSASRAKSFRSNCNVKVKDSQTIPNDQLSRNFKLQSKSEKENM